MKVSSKMSTTAAILLVTTIFFFSTGPGLANGSPNPEAIVEVLDGIRDEANVAWWGFDPSDSTDFIQAAIDSGASRVIIPNMGQDWNIRPIFLRSNLELIFEEGVVITAKKGEFHGLSDSLFSATDADNIIIRGYGATLRMHREDYTTPAYRQAQWRMGIYIRGVKNLQILGLTIENTGGDGIYLGRGIERSYNENVVIKDIVADNNHRQGMSVISVKNLLVEDSVFRNTSGTPPMAGIDFEPNRFDEKMENVVVRNTIFENNLGSGIAIVPREERETEMSFLFENIIIRGGRDGIRIDAGVKPHVDDATVRRGRIDVRNCIIEGTELQGILIRADRDTLEMNFEACTLHNVAHSPPSHRHDLRDSVPIFLGALRHLGSISFKDVVVSDTINRPVLYGRIEETPVQRGFTNITGDIRVVNPHGADIKWDGDLHHATLNVVEKDSHVISYDQIASHPQYQLSPLEVQLEPTIHISNLAALRPYSVVHGTLIPDLKILHIDESDVHSLRVTLNGSVVYSGPYPPVPGPISIDTTLLDDGQHQLSVIAEIPSQTLEESVPFITHNFEYMIDRFEGPKELAWFGTVYTPLVIDQSDGWQYVTDRPNDFFGDRHRKVKKSETAEYLVWNTPSLRSFDVEMYTRVKPVVSSLRIEGSNDQTSWEELDFTVEYLETSDTGWHRAKIQGDVDPVKEINFFRLILDESVETSGDNLQLGDATFKILRTDQSGSSGAE